ncbi:MAG: hypothetical protein RM049_11040 [Nostoc sp. DedQUE04]|uniref:hypothetical protein n=1 Tax=Nostoc sp. DedQUE04 TaxID=3075390 RepID=UPI002AD27850|nr:hypothetical protein [Nostoc sp. DedQUE04]MDZ8135821.1 hypothetical protein [Nostoc sp. DedQUE04]
MGIQTPTNTSQLKSLAAIDVFKELQKLQERQRAEGRRQKERSINKNFSSGLLPS